MKNKINRKILWGIVLAGSFLLNSTSLCQKNKNNPSSLHNEVFNEKCYIPPLPDYEMKKTARMHLGIYPIFSPARDFARPYDTKDYFMMEKYMRNYRKYLIKNNQVRYWSEVQNKVECKFDPFSQGYNPFSF